MILQYISQTDENDRLVYFKHFIYSCEEDLEKIGALGKGLKPGTDADDKIQVYEIVGEDDSSAAIIKKNLKGALGYITINLGEIKRQIFSKIKL